MFSGLMKH